MQTIPMDHQMAVARSPLMSSLLKSPMTSQSLVMTSDDDYDKAILGAYWQDLEIEVTLDSGASTTSWTRLTPRDIAFSNRRGVVEVRISL